MVNVYDPLSSDPVLSSKDKCEQLNKMNAVKVVPSISYYNIFTKLIETIGQEKFAQYIG